MTIQITNSANRTQALQAAANVLAAIQKIKASFADEDPSEVVYLNGTRTTIGEMLDHLKDTQFVITDKAYPNSGGVGGAFYNPDGTHRIEFNFENFDGLGYLDYASPAYSDQQGLVGIILHELGHVTAAGDAFWDLSNFYHAKENGHDKTTIPFAYGDYFNNEEAWVNAYSQQFAAAVGLSIDGWNPAEGFAWVDPGQIYNQNRIDEF